MEYYSSGSVTDMSVNDVFESEVRSEMDKILRSDSARFSPQPAELSLQTTTLDSTDFTDLGTYFHDQVVHTTTQDIIPTSVMTTSASTVDLNQISGMDGVENSIHSLLVDPQTGLPVSTASALQLDPNSAQASLQMIVNHLPELQAHIAATTADTLGIANIGNIITQAPIFSLGTQQLQSSSPIILSNGQSNQNITIQNGQLHTTDLGHINLSNVNELTAQTLISQLQQQQQLHLANGNVQSDSISDLNPALKAQQKNSSGSQPASPKPKSEKVYPKPAYSYSCLITMALKNSQTGCLPVSEIYQFMW